MSDSPPPTPLDYARPSHKPSRLPHPLAWVAIGLIGIFLWSILSSSMRGQRRDADRAKCHNQLRALGQAMFLYANEHDGRYPDTFGQLLMDQDVTTAIFVCPSSDDERAADGSTLQETAANLHAKGHLSYIYLGKGLTSQMPADFVLAYESVANHENKGMNILFGDGHVAFIPRKDAVTLLAELQLNHNPSHTPIPWPNSPPSSLEK